MPAMATQASGTDGGGNGGRAAFLAATTALTRSAARRRPLCRARTRSAKRRRAAPRMGTPSPEERREAEFVLDGASAGAGGGCRETFDWAAWRASGEAGEMPLLPFAPEEIFLPGEVKRLHIYEARFLALFERVVLAYGKTFAHVLFASDRAALAAYGTIVRVRSWRRLELGVYLEIEGIARLRVSKLQRAAPYWAGDCRFVDDRAVTAAEAEAVGRAERRVWTVLREVLSLCARLGEDPTRRKVDPAARTMPEGAVEKLVVPPPSLVADNGLFVLSTDAKIAMWESGLKAAARRAANDEKLDFETEDIAGEARWRRAKALSFAAWDFFPSNPADRQKALEGQNTLARLQSVVQGLERYGRSLAAKAAVQDVFKD